MKRTLSIINKKGLFIVLPFAVLISLGIFIKKTDVEINLTPSMPIGLYYAGFSKKTEAIHIGDTVTACLSHSIGHDGVKHGYITKGSCPSGAEPVIKEVIALPNDTVKLTNRQIIVNPGASQQVYFAPIHVLSLSGHPIRAFITPGVYRKKELWLYGNGAKNLSWDSRYFGPVKKKQIKHVMKPLLTF
jgi:conjugative transfer signal peptidase TraF